MFLKLVRKFFHRVRPFRQSRRCRLRIAGRRVANERDRVFERMADYATPIRPTASLNPSYELRSLANAKTPISDFAAFFFSTIWSQASQPSFAATANGIAAPMYGAKAGANAPIAVTTPAPAVLICF